MKRFVAALISAAFLTALLFGLVKAQIAGGGSGGGGGGGTSSNFATTFPSAGTAFGAEYLSGSETVANSQMYPLLVDSSGYLKVNVVAGGIGSNASVGTTGTTIPGSATYLGGLNGGNLVGVAVNSSGDLTVVGNGTFAAQLTGATNNINNVSGTVSLPTGAATSANQEVTVAGVSATSAQGVQGVTGGIALPISGTVTANAGTNLNTSALATDTHLTQMQAALSAGTAPSDGIPVLQQYNAGGVTPSTGQTVALQSDASGFLEVNIKAGAGSGGTALADNGAWTVGTTNFTPSGCEYTSGGATAVTTAHAGTVACTTSRAFFTDKTSVGGTALSAAVSAYGSAPTGTEVEGVNAFVTNTNANGSATSANSSPVVIASDQAAVAVKAASAAFASGSIASGAIASGAIASGAAVSGAFASGAVVDLTNIEAATAATVPTKAAQVGVVGETSDQTAVTAGQLVAPEATLNGKLITQPFALSGNYQSPTTTGQTSTGTVNVLAASGTAGIKEYMTGIQMGRSDAGTTAITAVVTDATSTYTFVVPNNGGGGGNNITFPTPIAFAANHAVTCAASSGVTTFYCTAQGYNAP